MKTLKFRTLASGIVVFMALFFALIQAEDVALREEPFLLTFVPNIQFSPVYAGIANGYFEEIGLDIALQYLNEPDVVDLIASGQASFGIVSGEQAILSIANERPVVYVYEWFQEYPVGLVVDAGTEITSIEDLVGARIGLPGRFGATYSGLTTLLLSAGLSEEDVEVEEIGFNAPEVVCLGAIDASVIYVNNEPLQIRDRAEAGECDGIEGVQVIRVADIADLVSNGILTSRALAAENPEFVRAFVSAFDRGLRDVISNPARAYLLSRGFVDNLPGSDEFFAALAVAAEKQDEFLATNPNREMLAKSREALLVELSQMFGGEELIQLEVLLASIELWDADRLGFSDRTSWENMENTLLTIGVLEQSVELESAFTNEFVPEFKQESE